MVNNKTKFKVILSLILFFLSSRLISNAELGVNIADNLLLQESVKLEDQNYFSAYTQAYCKHESYRPFYFKQEVAQFIGVIFLISIIIAFWWLIIPIDCSSKNRHKRRN